ncbi:retrovirus-related pol polyprotein from transposon TNT 1-94 [Tanacetum coccineum]|uniref:Retrovirus-related pol polyprotein from transposon TNT 1-94 n=1 Tax=Tanacetum coccineum TaxID=301880 RepID=A0ABQ5HIY8_9ASTR
MEEETNGRSVESMKEELTGVETKAEALVETPRSGHIGFYLKHEINKKLIEGLVDNHKYNDLLLATRLGKMDHETYKSLPAKSMYNAILKKKLVKNDDMEGNVVIPSSIGGIKYMNSLIDQGSDVNIMPMSFYNRLTDKEPVGIDVRLSLAIHSYIYPLGIAEDVLIDIVGYVYPVDFVILYIKENWNKPFILGTPFLTTAKAVIRFEKGTITLKYDKNKIDFVKVPILPSELEKNVEDDLDPITPTNTVSKLILDIWEALGGNTRDLDSIWIETGRDYNFTRSGFKDARTVPGDGVAERTKESMIRWSGRLKPQDSHIVERESSERK